MLATLGPLSPGNKRFWEELVRGAPTTPTVGALAQRLEVIPTSFVSRFVRAGLPTPKEHLIGARLCHAAKLFDEGDHTVADVAYRLEFASPQSLARPLRSTLGITPGEFRLRYPFGMMLDRYLDGVVRPYVEIWRDFKAVVPGRGERETRNEKREMRNEGRDRRNEGELPILRLTPA